MSLGYTIGDRLFFSLCHCASLFFLVKIRARNFFSKISQAPPPQNIKWTVPKRGFPVWSTGKYGGYSSSNVWEDIIPHMMAGILMEDWSMHLVYICHMHRCVFVWRHRKTHKSERYEICKLEGKKKWKRSDAIAWLHKHPKRQRMQVKIT